MGYDQALADRIRDLLGDEDGPVVERKMFGGLAFLVQGKLAIAASGQGGILVRCSPAKVVPAQAEPAIMRGRPMEGWFRVADDALRTKAQLRKWVRIGTESVGALPAKKARLAAQESPAVVRMRSSDLEDRIRAVCMALPGVTERPSHGSPAFFAGKQFLMLWPDGHHDHRFPHLWCAAPIGVQEDLVSTEPARFFRPPYVGGRGWLGVRLDIEVDWDELAVICAEAFRTVAPRKLLAALDVASEPKVGSDRRQPSLRSSKQ